MAVPDPLGQSDGDLLQQHVAGDPDAFGELVRRHRDRLWAVALRTLGNHDDAADGLQDGLLNAFRRAGSYRGDAAVTTWLHRIVVNACLDRMRRVSARPTSVLEENDHSRRLAAPDADPADTATLRLDVEQALATLPADQRVPLVLVDMDGYSVAETAQLLGVPPGTVKSRCARARAKLAPLLAPSGGSGHTGSPSAGASAVPDHTSGSAAGSPSAGASAVPDDTSGSAAGSPSAGASAAPDSASGSAAGQRNRELPGDVSSADPATRTSPEGR